MRTRRSNPAAPHPAVDWRTDDPAADRALIDAFLAGDAVAEAEFAARLQLVPRMLTAMNRRLGMPLRAEDLEDVAAETAAVVVRKAGELPVGAPFAAWLYRICSFEFRNAVRRRRRTEMTSLGGHEPIAPDGAFAQIERREEVLHALEQVRPDEANAILMHHFDGLTFVEIAERLRTTVNTIKGRYYRGTEQLRDLLRPSSGG